VGRRGEVLIAKGELCEVDGLAIDLLAVDWGLAYHFDGILLGLDIWRRGESSMRKLFGYFKSFSGGCVCEKMQLIIHRCAAAR